MKTKTPVGAMGCIPAAYGAFWAVILVAGGIAAMVFGAPPALMNAVSVLGSWTPTAVLLLLLKRLKPGTTIGVFYREAFRPPLKASLLSAAPALVFGIFAAAVLLASLIEGAPARFSLPTSLGGALLLTALQGPSGEESLWRGYLRPELEARFGFLPGNLILGLVWAFWHAPLWFLASGFSGLELLAYIVANIVVLTSLTLIMGVFMRRCGNLFIAFWIHFCFNLSLRLSTGGILFFILLTALYAAAAALLTAVPALAARRAERRVAA